MHLIKELLAGRNTVFSVKMQAARTRESRLISIRGWLNVINECVLAKQHGLFLKVCSCASLCDVMLCDFAVFLTNSIPLPPSLSVFKHTSLILQHFL